MSDFLVLCGGTLSRRNRRNYKVITLDVGASKLSADRVNLRISHITEPMLSDIPSRLLDLLEIAAYV